MPATPDLRRSHVQIPTADGRADAYLVAPDGPGRHPAVLVFMDAIGLRPRMEEMADRLAGAGYAVLVPNLFYRAGPAPVVPDIVARFQAGDRAGVFAELRPMMQALTPAVVASDTASYVEFLAAQPGVDAARVATTGYCMGGQLSLLAAAQLPERVVAAASFHGGHLAPDDPDGPQHGAPRIRAEVYVAHADDDPAMPPEQVARLEAALDAAGVTYTSEVYARAAHGFTMSDMPVYDAEAERRHWDALLGLLARTLPPA